MLCKETVTDTLWECLQSLMEIEVLAATRLVGGTALSLWIGHRMSIDLDLFTDIEYGSLDFGLIKDELEDRFAYSDLGTWSVETPGNTAYIGKSEEDCIKLDIWYTDPYCWPKQTIEGIRISSMEEIGAMKLEAVVSRGKKKDFWDIHALLETYSLDELIEFYLKRNPYTGNKSEVLTGLTNFETADQDLEPICLRGKVWDLIKLDMLDAVG